VPDPDHPTRARLLDAALGLGDERPLRGVSVDEITARAGVAKGTFYVHFPRREDFLRAVHDEVQRTLVERVGEATAGMPPGRDRLRKGCEAYLDTCLDLTGVKTLIGSQELRASGDAAASDDRWVAPNAVDLEAMGAADPSSVARLLVAVLREIVGREQTGGRNDDLRQACWSLFGL
jgi:TetR/AcrR family transcriptional regulator, transcriptional repressor for nem operon